MTIAEWCCWRRGGGTGKAISSGPFFLQATAVSLVRDYAHVALPESPLPQEEGDRERRS